MQYTALYARTSTLQQATGLEAQVRALKAWTFGSLDSVQADTAKLFTDEVSGRKSSRPGLTL